MAITLNLFKCYTEFTEMDLRDDEFQIHCLSSCKGFRKRRKYRVLVATREFYASYLDVNLRWTETIKTKQTDEKVIRIHSEWASFVGLSPWSSSRHNWKGLLIQPAIRYIARRCCFKPHASIHLQFTFVILERLNTRSLKISLSSPCRNNFNYKS